MALVLLGLGSNLGDRAALLDHAVAQLRAHHGVRVLAVSPWIETHPVGGPSGQGAFLNGALLAETALSPEVLLELLQAIERGAGRAPNARWAARPLDLDLLLYDDHTLATETLTVPHPRMAWRRFVLEPAAAIAPTLRHPTIGWTLERLLAHLDETRPYVAIAGPIASGKTRLARRLCDALGLTMLAEPIDDDRLSAFYADPLAQAWPTELALLDERATMLGADAAESNAKGSGPCFRSTFLGECDVDWPKHGPDPGLCSPPAALSGDRYVVSDFWYNQSRAFARVWLEPAALGSFEARWEALRHRVARPRLLVVLDAPPDVLHERIVSRGRPYEQRLSRDRLEQLRQSLVFEIEQPDVGPTLRIGDMALEAAVAEVSAALESMKR